MHAYNSKRIPRLSYKIVYTHCDSAQVEVVDISDRTALFTLAGPAAAEVLAGVGAHSARGLGAGRHSLLQCGGGPVIVAAGGALGPSDFTLLADESISGGLWRTLTSQVHRCLCLGALLVATLQSEPSMTYHDAEMCRHAACTYGFRMTRFAGLGSWSSAVAEEVARGGQGAVTMGANAWGQAAVLSGRPSLGRELTDQYNPLEAGALGASAPRHCQHAH